MTDDPPLEKLTYHKAVRLIDQYDRELDEMTGKHWEGWL